MVRKAKPEDAEAIAKVHVDSWRSTYRGIVPEQFLNDISYEKRAEVRRAQLLENDPKICTFVCEDDETGKIIGFAMGGTRREGNLAYDGELYAIYLFAENQGQGYGKELIAAVVGWLRHNSFKSMLVWVLDENPAKIFYMRMAAHALESKIIEIGGKPLLETSYGWPDLTQTIFS